MGLYMRRSVNTLWESVDPFYCMESRNQIQVVGLGGKLFAVLLPPCFYCSYCFLSLSLQRRQEEGGGRGRGSPILSPELSVLDLCTLKTLQLFLGQIDGRVALHQQA